MRPIRLHLDTSDYSVMYRAAPGSAAAHIRDRLKEMVEMGQIEIGLSYHVVFELLKKAEPKYREDRLARARLLSDLCGRNAFPYPTDLGQGLRFSTEGLWIPRVDLEDVEIERVIEHVRQGIAHHPNIGLHERRVFSKAKYFARWATNKPAQASEVVLEAWPELQELVWRQDNHTKLRLCVLARVDVYAFKGKRDVPRFECLLTHRCKPSRTKYRPASKKYTSRCPICESNKEIRGEIKSLFRLR